MLSVPLEPSPPSRVPPLEFLSEGPKFTATCFELWARAENTLSRIGCTISPISPVKYTAKMTVHIRNESRGSRSITRFRNPPSLSPSRPQAHPKLADPSRLARRRGRTARLLALVPAALAAAALPAPLPAVRAGAAAVPGSAAVRAEKRAQRQTLDVLTLWRRGANNQQPKADSRS